MEPIKEVALDAFERRALRAACAFYQHYLVKGALPEPERLKEIFDAAGEGVLFASPEDLDDIVAKLGE
ncbi:MAG: hypothetical protein INH37_13660 [Myxococcaceae bacterium]|nr:hypothetical protein [Myxococcaceae bacterium]